MMKPSSASVVRRLLPIALFCTLLSISCILFYEPFMNRLRSSMPTLGDTSDRARKKTHSSGGPVVVLMAYALTRALLEYARLALLLLCDEGAVQACYQQRCSAAQMTKKKRQDQTLQGKSGPMTTPEGEIETNEGSTGKPDMPVQSDHVSTNILLTPSLLPSDDQPTLKQALCGEYDDLSICGCQEEDFLVAMEDDVRKPGATPALTQPAKPDTKGRQQTAVDPSMRQKQQPGHQTDDLEEPSKRPAKASQPTDERAEARAQEEAEHHFRDDLLPAEEATSMDVF